MKVGEITRRKVAKLSDKELGALHKNLHSVETQDEMKREKREQAVWTGHDIVIAEMHTRNMRHKSPLGKGLPATKQTIYECMSCGQTFDSGTEDGDCPSCGGELRTIPLTTKGDRLPVTTDVDQTGDRGQTNAELDDGEPVFDRTNKDSLQKPYPTEHACRVKSPSGFDKIRRKNNAFGKGIHAIYGIKDNKSTVQALRFDKKKFTVKQAKAWAKKHGYTCMKFEAASGKAEKATTYKCECLDCGHKTTTTKHCKDIKCSECGGEMRRVSRPGVGKEEPVAVSILGKMMLIEEMGDAIREAFADDDNQTYAYMREIEITADEQNVIVSFSSGGDYIIYRVPFTVYEDGIELAMDDKVEVEEQVSFETAKTGETTWSRNAPLLKGSEDEEQQFALFVVYVPKEKDSQGEWATATEIEKMCWDFGLKCYHSPGGHIDKNHDEEPWKYAGCAIAENYVTREEGQMGLKKGTWLVGIKFGDDEWEQLKKGEIGAVSIGGKAERRTRTIEEADEDE